MPTCVVDSAGMSIALSVMHVLTLVVLLLCFFRDHLLRFVRPWFGAPSGSQEKAAAQLAATPREKNTRTPDSQQQRGVAAANLGKPESQDDQERSPFALSSTKEADGVDSIPSARILNDVDGAPASKHGGKWSLSPSTPARNTPKKLERGQNLRRRIAMAGESPPSWDDLSMAKVGRDADSDTSCTPSKALDPKALHQSLEEAQEFVLKLQEDLDQEREAAAAAARASMALIQKLQHEKFELQLTCSQLQRKMETERGSMGDTATLRSLVSEQEEEIAMMAAEMDKLKLAVDLLSMHASSAKLAVMRSQGLLWDHWQQNAYKQPATIMEDSKGLGNLGCLRRQHNGIEFPSLSPEHLSLRDVFSDTTSSPFSLFC